METTENLDFEGFQKALTPQHLLTFRVIYIALLLGVSLFLGIVLFMTYSTSEESKKPQGALGILTVVHVVLASSVYLVSIVLFRYMTGLAFFRKRKVASVHQDTSLEHRYLIAVFSAYIIRVALFEGPALFGVIVCLLGATEGTIQQNPIYWLNLFSYAILAILIIYTFPTRTKLEDLFKKRCIPKPAHVC
jgi:hypothetical protein